MNYKISQDQIQKIWEYLASKPFKEVVELMNILQTIEELNEDNKIEKD